MKNTIKKLNIFAFVFAGALFFYGLLSGANTASANLYGCQYYPLTCATYIDVGPGSGGNNNSGNNDGGNQSSNLNVNTLSATNVDEDSATLRGEITNINSNYSYERYFRWGTNSGNLNNTVYVSGTTNSTGTFSRTLSGLNDGQTYYYRACAERTTGSVNNCGAVRSFTTYYDNANNNNNNGNNNGGGSNTVNDVVAVTTTATGVTTNSAVLGGISMINAGGSGNAWFQFGVTTALGNQTAIGTVGTGTNNVSRQITGLTPNTTYYFRLVIQNSNGTFYGDYRFFTTGRVSTGGGTPTGGSSSGSNNSGTVAGASTTITSATYLGLEINSNLDPVCVGDITTYTVSYRNVSGKELKNVIMRVGLPRETAFRRTTQGSYSASNHSVIVTLDTLSKDAKGEFVIATEVLKDAAKSVILVTSLEGIHNHPTIEGAQANSANYSIVDVSGCNSNQAASTFSLGKFFPNTFLGWLLIALIILVIILIARKVMRDRQEVEEEKKEIKIAR